MKSVIRLAHIPPSTNGLYRNVNGRGRVKTERYKVWLQAVSHDMKKYHNHKWTEPVYLTIAIGKLRGNADVSNCIKAVEDLLVTYGVIPGDSIKWVRGVNVYLAQEPFEGVEIAITPAEPAMQEAA